eukprot:CAMPEP_0194125344 /NCGR_PEP_ID=MMETSP0150-20130528/59414_1 /TAXON_ID=122233 /ORGANISM="Chaetoceros debilis, Strain MM31A-1" /LENGTH=130 /DNA_ID=CAMNT_0038819149 /DNA_START=541 /DNA_END=933 /DNA_ORIENTATION=+
MIFSSSPLLDLCMMKRVMNSSAENTIWQMMNIQQLAVDFSESLQVDAEKHAPNFELFSIVLTMIFSSSPLLDLCMMKRVMNSSAENTIWQMMNIQQLAVDFSESLQVDAEKHAPNFELFSILSFQCENYQ